MKNSKWFFRSHGYYSDVVKMLRYFIAKDASVLGVGENAPWLLEQSSLSRPATLLDQQFENTQLNETFDFIVLPDFVPFAYDIQTLLENSKNHLKTGGRVFVSTYNSYLRPFFRIFEALGLKSASKVENWLTVDDLKNIADLAGFEVIREGHRVLLPWKLLGIGTFINRWLAPLPIFNWINLYYYCLLRPIPSNPNQIPQFQKVSVVVPARNEAGNIAGAVSRLPKLANEVELIFVEGNSTDNTWEVIQETVKQPTPSWLKLSAYQQTTKGKANAVHKGFEKATGDILMILDADLTVTPEDLPRFLKPFQEGRADFTHGSRLIYPMEKEAMRFLNILGNKFFSIAFTFLLGQRFKDTLCGTKVLWRKDWDAILELRRTYFGEFDPFGDYEMLFGAVKLNRKIAEIPVHYRERTYGTTNISRFRHGLILLKMVLYAAPRFKFL